MLGEERASERPFPVDIKLEDAREAVRGCSEFSEKSQRDFIVFNYAYCNSRTFPDPWKAPDARTAFLRLVKRECRGLVISSVTGRVIARRYHKFFNIGELEETKEENIQLSRPHVILHKHDGSLVTPIKTQGEIKFATKGGITAVSEMIEERFIKTTTIPYYAFCEHWISKDFTPIFEWCSPRTKIVLHYENDLLILTGIRHNITGMYVPFRQLKDSANEFKIPTTEAWVGNFEGLSKFQESIKDTTGIEGFVIRFEDDGTMYKVKTNWYFDRTKKEKQEFSLNSERSIWQLIVDQQIDDALAFMKDDLLQRRVKEFEITLWDAIEREAKRLDAFVKEQKSKGIVDKKEFVENTRKQFTNLYYSTLFAMFDSTGQKEPSEFVIQYIKKNTSNPKDLENARLFLGGIRFVENGIKFESQVQED